MLDSRFEAIRARVEVSALLVAIFQGGNKEPFARGNIGFDVIHCGTGCRRSLCLFLGVKDRYCECGVHFVWVVVLCV